MESDPECRSIDTIDALAGASSDSEEAAADDINLDLSSPRGYPDVNNSFSLFTALPASDVPQIIISESASQDGNISSSEKEEIDDEFEIDFEETCENVQSYAKISDNTTHWENGDIIETVEDKEDVPADGELERSDSRATLTQEEAVDCETSAEFSDAVVTGGQRSTENEFTALKEIESETNIKDELELEADAINLDTILMKEKEESDSDSEFDFELPPAAAAKAPETSPEIPAVKPPEASTQVPLVKPPEASPESPAGKLPEISTQSLTANVPKDSQQDSVTSNVQTDIKKEEPRSEPASGADTTDAGMSTTAKPLAFVKPTPQALGFSYPTEKAEVAAKTQKDLAAAQDEWDSVTTIQPGFRDVGTKEGSEPVVVPTMPSISPYELSETLMQADFSGVRSTIRPAVERRGFAAFINLLFGPPKLARSLIEERDAVFCIAATPLDNSNSSHIRTLQTIYRSLTGSKFDCARVGGHWEEIGFQGSDPATDLRGAGLLGLLNLLYFLRDPKKQSLASDIYRLSLHPTQNFPFCVMGINMSKITLQTLREEGLNKECNRRGDILGVVNEFYVALYLQLYQIWKGQGKTISDSGYVIKDLEMRARKNPRGVLKNLDDYLNRKTTIVAEKSTDLGGDNFVNVCD